MRKTITFFFGSGADTDFNKRLVSGAEFAEALLCGKYDHELSVLVNPKIATQKLIYPTSSKVFLQTVEMHKSEAEECLGESNVKLLCEYYNHIGNHDYQSEIGPICKNIYQEVTGNGPSSIKNFFLKKAIFCDCLDEKFNALRFPNRLVNANRVKYAYWAIFVLMLKSLYNIPEKFSWKFEDVLDLLNKDYDVLSEQDKGAAEPEGYYQELAKLQQSFQVVTTNYTTIAETVTGKNTIYLHGQLKWFEDLEKLSLYCSSKNVLTLKDYNNIIPFILIPSGVKPLICTRQIREFSSFIDSLSKTKVLLIVGYRFNTEDNHINSIIAEWLAEKGKQMIYLNFNGEVDFSSTPWAKYFMINNLDADKQTVSESLIKDGSIVSIKTNKDNSRIVFKRLLEILGE